MRIKLPILKFQSTVEDNEIAINFTEAENKIRKIWLFLSVILSIAITCYVLINELQAYANLELEAIYTIILMFLISMIVTYIDYYCAYKNPGTFLLLWNMLRILLKLFYTPAGIKNLATMKITSFF